MRTFSLLKGMPVFSQGGELLGEVCDICIGEDGLVTDLLLHVKGLIGKKFRIPLDKVMSFGESGIMIEGKEELDKYHEIDDEFTLFHHQPLSKKNTLSQTGEQLGLLDDVYFLEEVGTIVGYELTDGFFSDITEGKRVIRTPDPPVIGKDALIVSVKSQRGVKSHDEMSKLPK